MTTETLPGKSTQIETKHPNQNWIQIWRNLHDARIPETICSNRYNTIHDIIPTKRRLHRIALTNTDRCAKCGKMDTLLHRLMDCGTGKEIWKCTQDCLATLFKTRPQHIPTKWTLLPNFNIKPIQRHRAILWL